MGEGKRPFDWENRPTGTHPRTGKVRRSARAARAGIVANFGQAAVYEYHNGPERRMFMDGRLEVCTRQTFEQYNAILQSIAQGDSRWVEPFLDNLGTPPAVLLDSRGSRPLIVAMLQTPRWRLGFADPTGVVFLDDATADRLGLPMVSPEPLNETPGLKKPGKP